MRYTPPPHLRRAHALRARRAVLVPGILLAAAWLGLVIVPAGAQAPNPRQQQVLVSVIGPDGAPVAGLAPTDFTVREDGVVREALRVAPATEPIDIAILIDNTQAATPAIQDIRNGLKAFVQAVHPRNPIALVTFADRPTLLSNYTLDRAATAKAIERVFAQEGSGSALLEAILETTVGLAKRQGHAAIVVVTGEGQEFSNRSHQEVVEAIRRSGAAFNAEVLLNVGDRTTDDAGRERGLVLDDGPRVSGGRSRMLITSLGLRAELESLAAELNNRYVLTYGRTETLIPPDKIEVSVKQPDWTVRATPIRATPKA